MRSPTLRLFIALWPSDEVREQIAHWQSQWEWPERAAVVPPDQLHVTLHFLGDVPAERVLDLKYVLKPIPAPRFALHFSRVEFWPHGIAALRPDNSPTALRALHARIGLALATIAVPLEERAYRPHVTLARRAFGATAPAQAADVTWESKGEFVLVRTLGGSRGYEIIERFGA